MARRGGGATRQRGESTSRRHARHAARARATVAAGRRGRGSPPVWWDGCSTARMAGVHLLGIFGVVARFASCSFSAWVSLQTFWCRTLRGLLRSAPDKPLPVSCHSVQYSGTVQPFSQQLQGRGDRFGTLLQHLGCGFLERTALMDIEHRCATDARALVCYGVAILSSTVANRPQRAAGSDSRSPKNPSLQQFQKCSKSASVGSWRPIWNSFATVGVWDFWENGCRDRFGTLLELLQCGIFGRAAVRTVIIQLYPSRLYPQWI